MKQPFDQWKREVLKLAKREKVTHLCPGNNTLYRLWEIGYLPCQIVVNHCTEEMTRKRHDPDYVVT